MGSLPKLLVRLTTKERDSTSTEKGEDLSGPRGAQRKEGTRVPRAQRREGEVASKGLLRKRSGERDTMQASGVTRQKTLTNVL